MGAVVLFHKFHAKTYLSLGHALQFVGFIGGRLCDVQVVHQPRNFVLHRFELDLARFQRRYLKILT